MKPDEVLAKSESYLRQLLHGNGLKKGDLTISVDESDEYGIEANRKYHISLKYKSNRVAGGAAGDEHYTDKSSYEGAKEKWEKYASQEQSARRNFGNGLIAEPVKALSSDGEWTIWNSPRVSYSWNCGSCKGSGRLTCTRCNGRGRERCRNCQFGSVFCPYCSGNGYTYKTVRVTDAFNNYIRDESRRTSCVHCSGMGKTQCRVCHGTQFVVCSSCRGSGDITCGSCGGSGFFTDYWSVSIVAEPSTTIEVEKGLHHGKVHDWFVSHSSSYLCTHVKLNLENYSWGGLDLFSMNFSGSVCVVVEKIEVKGQEFKELAVNDIPGLIKPPIFDHVLSGLVERFSKFQLRRGFISWLYKKKHAIELFKKAKSYRVTNSALLAYQDIGDAGRDSRTSHLRDVLIGRAEGYISRKSAGVLSQGIVDIMRSIAPHQTTIVWFIAAIPVIFVEAALAFTINLNSYYVYYNQHGIWGYVFVPVVALIAFFIVFAPIAALVNEVVTQIRQRRLPRIYRPLVFNRKPFVKTATLIFAAWIPLAIYASFLYEDRKMPYLFIWTRHFIYHNPFLQHVWSVVNEPSVALFLNAPVVFANKWLNALSSHLPFSHRVAFYSLMALALIIFIMPTVVAFWRKSSKKKQVALWNVIAIPLFAFMPLAPGWLDWVPVVAPGLTLCSWMPLLGISLVA